MVSPITPVQPADALRIGAAWRLLSTNDPTLSAAILSEIEHPHHPAVDEALRAVLRYPIARHRLRGDADSAGPLISPDGRLFACVPGTHPHEAAFEAVLRELHPELAAMVVFGRIVEAEEMFDESSATRLWAKLQTGPLADTDFARNLKDMGESGPLPEQ